LAEWEGRVAVITGAGSGLGEAMARAFAAEGMKVAALDIDGAAAEAVAASLAPDGVETVGGAVDVADRRSLESAADTVAARFGACHVLCANVGVQQFGALDRLTVEDWQWVLSVNVLGTVSTVAAFLPLLRASSGARHILLTASSSALLPGERLGAYVTSKFAVMGFGECLRLELAPEGIGVSLLFPAGMSTRHLESSRAARPPELGPSVTLDDDIQVMLASRDSGKFADPVSPGYAIRNLISELASDPPYIITHGTYLSVVEERLERIRDAFERMQAADAESQTATPGRDPR
jgi:NAD(P)-dependent dehydrogenase (short-subunit alcohol dehydrogenase family)